MNELMIQVKAGFSPPYKDADLAIKLQKTANLFCITNEVARRD